MSEGEGRRKGERERAGEREREGSEGGKDVVGEQKQKESKGRGRKMVVCSGRE